MEHWVEYLICALAALAAGFVNSIAGGGTLLTFPALVYSLGTEVLANTTSTVGLFPGSLAGAWGSRAHLKGIKTWLLILIPPYCGKYNWGLDGHQISATLPLVGTLASCVGLNLVFNSAFDFETQNFRT